jgi:uncharacterized protein
LTRFSQISLSSILHCLKRLSRCARKRVTDSMSQYFLDSSAVAKRYLPETGSDWVRHLCVSETVAVSSLVIVEMSATLARRTREGLLTTTQRDGILARFRRHLTRYVIVESDLSLLDDAGSIAVHAPSTIAIRSLDAIQLASAQVFERSVSASGLGPVTFVSADSRLLAAAQWAGFAIDDPNAHP